MREILREYSIGTLSIAQVWKTRVREDECQDHSYNYRFRVVMGFRVVIIVGCIRL